MNQRFIYINKFFVIFISLWLDINRTEVSFIVKADFRLHHNLEGKYDNITYSQSGFYWCKTKFQMIRIGACHVQSG